MGTHIKIIGSLIGVSLLIVLGSNHSPDDTQTAIRGAILPHHNLVGEYIDEFYSDMAEERGDTVDTIILISTNHFDTGYHVFQGTDQVSNIKLDTETIEEFSANNLLAIERSGLELEHGITVHTERIPDYFPKAEVIPIMVKWKAPQNTLDDLFEALQQEIDMDRALVIASIDFSHYVTEETAVANDERTIEWLEEWGSNTDLEITLQTTLDLEKSTSMDTEIATAMDSPETLYIFTKLMGDPAELEIWERTSSHSIYGGNDAMENTSHLFVKVR